MNNEITLRSNVQVVSAIANGDGFTLTFEGGTIEKNADRGVYIGHSGSYPGASLSDVVAQGIALTADLVADADDQDNPWWRLFADRYPEAAAGEISDIVA